MDKIKPVAYARVDGENPAPIGFDPATNEFRSMSSGPTPTDKVNSDSAFYAMWLMLASLVHGMESEDTLALQYMNEVAVWLDFPPDQAWTMANLRIVLKGLIDSGTFALTPIQPNITAKKARISKNDKTK